jgi:hypothetical protein
MYNNAFLSVYRKFLVQMPVTAIVSSWLLSWALGAVVLSLPFHIADPVAKWSLVFV